ncbi:putative Kinesin-like protein KIF20A [Hypsibius exemplaris]|uniref:Kinesin-like protein KIF20A n=1 Tax=Hypsibius exemplaris TaxID=2072580 RepID=A0A1W0X072_HYPEX|nr:putative Kinesin-like protein KIF20A [Hypsibius exemplaris]
MLSIFLTGPRGNPGILPRALDRIFAALGGNVSESCKHQPVKYEDIILLDSQAQREAKDRRENYLAQKAPKAPKEPAPVVVSSSSASSQDFHSQASQSTDSHGFFDYRPVSEMDHEVIHDRDCLDEQAKYEVWVSFVEIYEDVAYDLLDMNNAVKTGRALRSGTLKITDEGDTCYARGLIEVPVFSAADAYHVMGLGRKNLHVAMTKLNDASSRSHSIFTVKLVKLALNGKEAFVTQLTFCDLAGTERANRTDNTGIRMKESQNINKDLHHLKECIEALRKSRSTKPGRKKEMVPYRNCKLTRLFRSFFSGRGRASMIVNISQCASDFDETVQAIRFGASAMRIMITMSKRESILLRQPGDYRKIAGKNVISVEVEESLADIDENDEEGSGAGMSDDEEFDDDDNAAGVSREHITETAQKVRGGGGSRTITKKPNPPTGSKTKTKQNRARRQDSNIKSHLKPRAQSADKPVRRGRQPMSIGGGRPLDDESTSEEASSTDATNTDSDTGRSSTAGEEEEDYGQEEDEDVNEADLTLGSAVRGARKIPEDFWEENCPFPEHRHEKDPRVRGLLLLLGSCQTQIKQSKALNMTNEMKVRKDLCDYYDKEREKQAREFQKLLKKREAEFEEDLQRQLKYQRDHDERMYQSRIDPSLVSFEQHEKDEEVDELRRENAHLRQQLEEAGNRTLD